jgi:hypothetical protein
MYQRTLSALLAALVIAGGITQAVGQSTCRPTLAFKGVQFSEVRSMHREWTARLQVDASRCATHSGRFEINFVRLKEAAPDLPFTEQFIWKPGTTEVSLFFWADEAVLSYSIGAVGPCVCRD